MGLTRRGAVGLSGVLLGSGVISRLDEGDDEITDSTEELQGESARRVHGRHTGRVSSYIVNLLGPTKIGPVGEVNIAVSLGDVVSKGRGVSIAVDERRAAIAPGDRRAAVAHISVGGCRHCEICGCHECVRVCIRRIANASDESRESLGYW